MRAELDPTQNAKTRRLFFALWPTDQLRQQIHGRIQPLLLGRNARPIPAVNFHVTLMFLGTVGDADLANVMQAAGEIQNEAFDLTFDHVETWTSAHIACLSIVPTPAALGTLVDQLRARLSARNVEPDHKDFKAHVTIARDWRDKALDQVIDPLVWSAREFVLVESRAGRAGSEYTVVNRWPLGARTRE